MRSAIEVRVCERDGTMKRREETKMSIVSCDLYAQSTYKYIEVHEYVIFYTKNK